MVFARFVDDDRNGHRRIFGRRKSDKRGDVFSLCIGAGSVGFLSGAGFSADRIPFQGGVYAGTAPGDHCLHDPVQCPGRITPHDPPHLTRLHLLYEMPVLIGDRLHHKRPHQNTVICNGRSCRNQLKCRHGKALPESDGAGIDFGPPIVGG